MVALEARLRLLSNEGERWVGAADFFVDIFTTALEPTELLVEIDIPALPVRSGWGFREVARRHGDYALVGAAAVVTLNEQGACQMARLVFFSVGPGPVLARQAVALLEGEQPSAEAIDAAADAAATQDIEPTADIHASVAYRRHLARALARQTLTQAVERAKAKGT
jgi:carbon-monoxide dehydrogenase medium subunit